MTSHFKDASLQFGQKWFSYYWILCKKFGAECYKTWRWELLASLVLSTATYLLTVWDDRAAWKNFKVVLFATALTLAAFAVWHLVRSPWRIHRRVLGKDDPEDPWGFGMLGVAVLSGMLIGAYFLAASLWEIRNIPVTIRIPAPPVPQFQNQTKVLLQPPPESEKKCRVSQHFGFPNSRVEGAVTATQAILHCNYRIEAPFAAHVEFDRDFIPGATTLDSGAITEGVGGKDGRVYISPKFISPALLTEQLVVVTVYGKTDQYPKVINGKIMTLK